MTLPDPRLPINPGNVYDRAVEDEVLPPVTEEPVDSDADESEPED